MTRFIKNNEAKNSDTFFPLDAAFPTVCGPFFVDGISEVFEYVEGQRTDRLLGYRYELCSAKTRDSFDLFVEQDRPVIPINDFQSQAALGKDIQIILDSKKVYCRPKSINFGKTAYKFFSKSEAISLYKPASSTTTGTN